MTNVTKQQLTNPSDQDNIMPKNGTPDYDLSTLDKVNNPTIGNIITAQNQIAAILTDYPCESSDSGAYGHAFLIYSDNVWRTKNGIIDTVIINKPAAYNGTTHASRYIYADELNLYEEMEKHRKGAIRMIKHIFPEPFFLDLCDDQGQIVGKSPQEIIQHLHDTFCDDEEKEEEILKQYRAMHVEYNPAEYIQIYYKALQDARTILVTLQETINDKILIRQAIDQFNKHMDLNEAVDEWKKTSSQNKNWKNFKTHFAKAVTKNQKRAGSLKNIGIANEVQELVSRTREEAETLAQVQIQQLATIEALNARLAVLENPIHHANIVSSPSPSIPSVITPPATVSDDMSQITNMLQAMMAAQGSKVTPKQQERRPGKRPWNINDNDLPNGQRSKRRHPESDAYCHSCGYDLPPVHTSKTCKWKKEGHIDEATINKKMGGSERNCFHFKGK